MYTLLVGTSALTLLLSLLTGQVTMAEETRVTCRQMIPPGLIRELWTRTRHLLDRLPNEEKPSRRSRLLPKFCTKCSEGAVGWLEIREMMDTYQRTVFSREVVKKLLPLHFPDLLYRLQNTLRDCVPPSKPSKWLKVIKKLERKIKKRRRDDGALKAVGEFTFILRWIDELTRYHVL